MVTLLPSVHGSELMRFNAMGNSPSHSEACRELQEGVEFQPHAQAAKFQAGNARGYLFAGLLGACALIKGVLNSQYGWQQVPCFS